MNAMKRRNRICKRSNRSRNLPVGGASLALAAGFEPSCGDRSSRGRWTAAGAAVCLAGLLPVVTTTPAYATLRYNITVLAAPSGGGSYAFGVNTSGQVVGDVGTYGNYHAFLYSNGIMTDLGTLGGGRQLRPRHKQLGTDSWLFLDKLWLLAPVHIQQWRDGC